MTREPAGRGPPRGGRTPRGEGPAAEERPPASADALLQRWLPDGVLGLSILGDLHEEFGELIDDAGPGRARWWYWRSAVALSVRYAGVRARHALAARDSMASMGREAMATLWSDVRYGFRMLLKTPLVSVVAIITVALGVALTTHTFSSVHGAILRGVPVPGHERLTYIGATRFDLGIDDMELSIHDFQELREQQTAFDDLAAFSQGTVNLAGDDAPPERFAGAHVSDNFFELAGVRPAMGRTFRAGEDDFGAALTAVIGYHVWQNRFGGDADIVGRTLRLNGETAEVIGVMPEGFRFPFLEDIWIPHRTNVAALRRGAGRDFDVFGRWAETGSLEGARAELDALAARFAAAYPDSNAEIGFYAEPYTDQFMPREIRAVLWVMLSATFGVLLIACANVANLLMARTSIRSREIAVRTALGAGRWRVIRQLLMESLALAVLGGTIGVLIAWGGVEYYRLVVADIYKPYWIDFRMDLPVLGFSLVVTAIATVAAGIVPALRASGLGLGEILKDEGRGSSSLRMGRLTNALVMAEIAVSCALLVGAGFMVRSVVNLRNVDLGFDTEGVMTGRVGLFETDYPDPESRDRFFVELRERLATEPGVTHAAVGSTLPGLGGPNYFMSIEGTAYANDRERPAVNMTLVSSDYFATFGVDVVRGRGFSPLETQRGGDAVAIVNQSFAARYLADTPVLGERVRLGLAESGFPWHRVVGVVPDMHIGGNVGGIGDDEVAPERLFLPQGALDASFMSLALRTGGDPAALAPRVRAVVAQLDPDLPVYDLQPLGKAVQDATWAFGIFGTLFTIFGAAALFLASVGLYGVMAFGVAQRRREIGVRMALGADANAVLRLVMGSGMRQLAIGMVVGLGLGAAMSQAMRIILYDVDTGDPVVYGAIIAALGLTGLLATLIPARAALGADPVEAMRPGG
ncbi:MAG: ABC transporter permease [Gemmatimonadetes bacterium]|nr:ABC transporter permease [Gemmatimonadota bacterium]